MTKPFIIMGANGGIGEALALRLLEKKHKLFVTLRPDCPIPQSLQNSDVKVAFCDVLQDESIETAFAQLELEKGIAGFAYCIGSINIKTLRSAGDQDFLDAYRLNVLGAIRALRFLENGLKTGKASIVLFSSIAVQQGFSNHTVISTAKGAIEGLTRALAAEWSADVRVNCIAPSLTQTKMAASITTSDTMAKSIASLHPIARLGTTNDSAALAEFLLMQDSAWITGQILHVDGGRSALRVKG